MFERLFGSSEKTRFENHIESKLILPHLAALRSKEKELKRKAASHGSQSLDYSKYKIVNRLLSNFDEKISQFNSQPAFPHYEAEAKALSCLIRELFDISLDYRAFYQELKKHRNSQRWLVSNLLWAGTLATTYVGATALSFSTVGVGATVLVGGNTASSYIQSITGLDDDRSASVRIFSELETTLASILEKLREHDQMLQPRV